MPNNTNIIQFSSYLISRQSTIIRIYHHYLVFDVIAVKLIFKPCAGSDGAALL